MLWTPIPFPRCHHSSSVSPSSSTAWVSWSGEVGHTLAGCRLPPQLYQTMLRARACSPTHHRVLAYSPLFFWMRVESSSSAELRKLLYREISPFYDDDPIGWREPRGSVRHPRRRPWTTSGHPQSTTGHPQSTTLSRCQSRDGNLDPSTHAKPSSCKGGASVWWQKLKQNFPSDTVSPLSTECSGDRESCGVSLTRRQSSDTFTSRTSVSFLGDRC